MSTTRLIADADTTTALARTLAGMARPGLTILLDGPVGAGKTHFASAFIQARQGDIAEDVPSPTFTLVQTYDDPMGTEIWHADLYRLTDPSELDELGLDEAAETAIRLIEWPDRLEMLPDGALTVAMASTPDPHLRQITLHGPGAGRIAAIARFIAATGRAGSRVVPLAGDASARRYFRLQGPQGRAVLMDDPSGDCAGFVQMTRWLRSHGFGAPELLAADDAAGLLLVEDLGDDLLARVLEKRPGMARALYERITDLLVALHRHPVPDFVRPLDGPLLAEQVGLFAAWYPQAAGAPATDAAGIGPVMTTFLFEVKNVPAALYKAMGGFATNGVNMTKLESYQKGAAFAATEFYADIVGAPGQPARAARTGRWAHRWLRCLVKAWAASPCR